MSSGSSLGLTCSQSISGLGEGPGQSVGFCPAPNYDTDATWPHASTRMQEFVRDKSDHHYDYM